MREVLSIKPLTWIVAVVLYSIFALIGNWHRRRRFRQWWAVQSEELRAEIEAMDPTEEWGEYDATS